MPTIHRAAYRGQCHLQHQDEAIAFLQEKTETLSIGTAAGQLLTISLFHMDSHLFLYWESIDQPVDAAALFKTDPDSHFAQLLQPWPGTAAPRLFVPMFDIFHYQSPADLDHWLRKTPVTRHLGRLARLKPHMASSYIYYHYQLQEELPGRGDKYGIITLHENLIFFYQEQPAVVEPAVVPGKLSTRNTPDAWQDVMFPHFHLWDDAPSGQHIWRELDHIASRTI